MKMNSEALKELNTAVPNTTPGLLDDLKTGRKVTVEDMHTLAAVFKNKRISAFKRVNSRRLDDTSDALENAHKRLSGALDDLVKMEMQVAERSKKLSSTAREEAQRMAEALVRINKMLGSDFEARLTQLERLTNALSTLRGLEDRGFLSRMLTALGKG